MNSRLLRAAVVVMPLLIGCGPGSQYQGYPMEPPVQTSRLQLHGGDATTLSFAETGGRVTLTTFGYTSCPDVCPTTLADWRKLRRALGADTSRVRFVFVSADWRRDTPAIAGEFASRFDPAFIGVTADSTTLLPVMKEFKVAASYEDLAARGGYDFSHTDYSYLVDPDGRIVLSYEFGVDMKKIGHDIRRMLRSRP